jgi:hypothetical protein
MAWPARLFETRLTTDIRVDPIKEAFMNPAPALVLLSVAAFLTSCTTDPTTPNDSRAPQFASGGSGPSASGHIERDLGGVLEKYSFNAHNLGNSKIGGRFNVRDIFPDGSGKDVAKGSVTCFTVEPDGKTARMGGIVESATNPDFVGTDAVWTVVDNGEGQKDPPDQGTDLRWALPPGYAEFHCTVGFPPEAFGTFGFSGRGNVQVRP